MMMMMMMIIMMMIMINDDELYVITGFLGPGDLRHRSAGAAQLRQAALDGRREGEDDDIDDDDNDDNNDDDWVKLGLGMAFLRCLESLHTR